MAQQLHSTSSMVRPRNVNFDGDINYTGAHKSCLIVGIVAFTGTQLVDIELASIFYLVLIYYRTKLRSFRCGAVAKACNGLTPKRDGCRFDSYSEEDYLIFPFLRSSSKAECGIEVR